MSEDRNLVQAVLKALELMEVICREKHCGIRELSQKVGITRSTVNRLVATLERAGFVEQENERGKYRATLKVFEMGNEVIQHLDIREKAYPIMLKLSAETEETINLAVLDGYQVIYISKIDSPHLLKSSAPVGSRPPIYCNASGKVILAYLPEDRKQILFPTEFTSFTPNTISSIPEMEAELARIRVVGYAVDNEEWSLNTRALAAPVNNYDGKIMGALTIAGPSIRMTPVRLDDLTGLLLAAAQELSFNLGFREVDHVVTTRYRRENK